jgi:hypothetical protein
MKFTIGFNVGSFTNKSDNKTTNKTKYPGEVAEPTTEQDYADIIDLKDAKASISYELTAQEFNTFFKTYPERVKAIGSLVPQFASGAISVFKQIRTLEREQAAGRKINQ